ncbi:U3 small nucleolar RNA-associated protein 25 [Cinnamomum micranthum f. kanehirae]|uniref:U3 small nucleolar RNA-associated protein 25 n=1 Tax=Cinnamomum micranthum f. kanehirae TaxID=337451 RepID=A0A443P0G1_9MAGN|nr:U3 small nucleolar RNA-associated protein 25 [Cinnamomum micranthum f. kanehirae]
MPPSSKLTRGSRRGASKMKMEKFKSRKKGLKRPRTPDKIDTTQRSGKHRHANHKLDRSPSPSSSEHSYEEHSGSETSEDVVVYKEPSTYDNLLMALGSSSKSMANVYKRRQREQEGKSESSDTEEDEGEPESASLLDEEEDVEGGSDSESEGHADGNEVGEHSVDDLEEQSGEAGSEDEDEASDNSYENDLENDGQTALATSQSASSFSTHLGHVLSKADVDDLLKKKSNFEWEVPAVDMPLSKWVGTGDCFFKEGDRDAGYGLKLRLYKHWLDVYKTSGGHDFHSSKQRLFFTLCNSYRDIMHCNKKPFYLKGQEEDSSIMDGYIMHALNHVFTTRVLVTKNDSKLAKRQERDDEEILNDDRFLDHGFNRPKVLILLPLGSIALRVVKRLVQLTPTSHKANVEYIDRFTKEFGKRATEDDDDMIEKSNHVEDDGNSKSRKSSKPADFQALFDGNNEDHFMIGIKFTKKSIKLYGDFYSSDMIVASPVGLITKIGNAEVDKEKDVDFLSSIEVLIIDHADVIAMQNWSHVNSVVEQLNRIPSKQHGTDIMRIRQWYLDGHARFYRQTILLSSFLNPDMNGFFNHLCLNYQGKVKLISEFKGILPKVLLQVRQIYERFDATSVIEADDARFDYFTKKVFPRIKDSIQGGTMLFISSYFEFVRIRNFLKSQNASFCLLGEYTKPSDISRARVWFFNGTRKIMLYTERAHFYHRYKIRGMQNLIIYSLPERKEFYPEIVNMLEGSKNMSCTVLFSRLDNLRLERIVGTEAANKMLDLKKIPKKDVFVIC